MDVFLDDLNPIVTVSDGLASRYVMGTDDLATVLGVNEMANRVTDLSTIEGKTGIIYFENYHIDLWDGYEMVGNGDADYSSHPVFFKEIK